ncbi:MAG: hypothetical protein J6A28_01560 [Clostridia bacterium]|nr:hypothetical protein [Clostridia bacterium]
MNNMISQLLFNLLSGTQQTSIKKEADSPAEQNPSANNYPAEAFFNSQKENPQPQQSPLASFFGGIQGSNNMFSLLSGLLSKGDNPLANIMDATKKEESPPSSPKDELLL